MIYRNEFTAMNLPDTVNQYCKKIVFSQQVALFHVELYTENALVSSKIETFNCIALNKFNHLSFKVRFYFVKPIPKITRSGEGKSW